MNHLYHIGCPSIGLAADCMMLLGAVHLVERYTGAMVLMAV